MTKSTITRESITHELKIYPEFFSAVCTGVKRAELRKNDRDYRVGDTLHLMETPRGSCHRTGEFINVTITHIADVGEWMPGYVLLSVELQERRKADREPVFTLEVSQADYKGQKLGNHFGFITLGAARELKEGNYQIYTAQPEPVVPKSISVRQAISALESAGAVTTIGQAYKMGWNACRAAMLEQQLVDRVDEKSLTSINPAPDLVSLQKKAESIIGNYPGIPYCWCRTCRPVVLNDMRFVVCPDCGNKRCPRANDHRNACTGSNQPGQEGSAYPDTLQEPKP
ncbi:DUF3850 domain-containing protein [Klebsiella quasipneumoniae]|uniref:DUF3850 domain-containing protein n=1 Tax=Klebsiella quasipneumoniae TaxID=1463165 RepID=UPI003529EBE8